MSQKQLGNIACLTVLEQRAGSSYLARNCTVVIDGLTSAKGFAAAPVAHMGAQCAGGLMSNAGLGHHRRRRVAVLFSGGNQSLGATQLSRAYWRSAQRRASCSRSEDGNDRSETMRVGHEMFNGGSPCLHLQLPLAFTSVPVVRIRRHGRVVAWKLPRGLRADACAYCSTPRHRCYRIRRSVCSPSYGNVTELPWPCVGCQSHALA